jgi:hypothetical protein
VKQAVVEEMFDFYFDSNESSTSRGGAQHIDRHATLLSLDVNICDRAKRSSVRHTCFTRVWEMMVR